MGISAHAWGNFNPALPAEQQVPGSALALATPLLQLKLTLSLPSI